jgi:hypothetical protein
VAPSPRNAADEVDERRLGDRRAATADPPERRTQHQRVPRSRLEQPPDRRTGGPLAEPIRDQVPALTLGKRPEIDRDRLPFALQSRNERRHGCGRRRRPSRQHHEESRPLDHTLFHHDREQVLQQRQRCIVGPVQIFDHQRRHALPRRAQERAGRGEIEREARPIVVGAGLACRCGGFERIHARVERRQCTREREVRHCDVLLARSGEHLDAARHRVRSELVEQPRFADAGLSAEHHDLRETVARALECTLERRELRHAADEHLTRGCARRRDRAQM